MKRINTTTISIKNMTIIIIINMRNKNITVINIIIMNMKICMVITNMDMKNTKITTTVMDIVGIMVDMVDTADITNIRSEEHTSELQSRFDLVCRLLLEKKKKREYRTSAVQKT